MHLRHVATCSPVCDVVVQGCVQWYTEVHGGVHQLGHVSARSRLVSARSFSVSLLLASTPLEPAPRAFLSHPKSAFSFLNFGENVSFRLFRKTSLLYRSKRGRKETFLKEMFLKVSLVTKAARGYYFLKHLPEKTFLVEKRHFCSEGCTRPASVRRRLKGPLLVARTE